MSYDYYDSVVSDVKDWLTENYEFIKADVDVSDQDEFANYLNDTLWAEDSVTGNGSGSYTFNRAAAKENVQGDPKSLDYLKELCDEFGEEAKTIGEKFLNEDWEWFDVSIRCYLLGQAIWDVLEDADFMASLA